MFYRLTTAFLILGMGLPYYSLANSSDFKVSVQGKKGKPIKIDQTKEQTERNVDKVALQSQKLAEVKIQKLVKKYQGKEKHPLLLSKLSVVQQQMASLIFRIAHSNAHHSKTNVNLKDYNEVMKRSIKTLDTLIVSYPKFEDIPLAYFMRGKAYEEIENRTLAKRDYLHLVTNYPESRESTSAYMSLAQFAIDKENHAEAITYLAKVEERPYTPLYPFALYKLGWSHYNLKNAEKALSYLERHVKYYRAKQDRDKGLSYSDVAILDTTLGDITTFYIQAYEQGVSKYSLGNALDYFEDLERGDGLDRMLVRFARLLRSHGREADLNYWKNEILDQHKEREASAEVLTVALEFQLGRRRYDQVQKTSKDIVGLYHHNKERMVKWESYKKIQDLLLNTANEYRALTIKNKKATRLSELSDTLISIYDTFTKIVDGTDDRIPGVHYNLAETMFEIGQFDESTRHYRWIVDHWNGKDTKLIKIQDASLKAISARYRVLLDKKFIPKTLKALALSEDSSRNPDTILAEWVGWIDTHEEKYKNNDETFRNFQFEANRALYSQKKIKLGVSRLVDFVKKYPTSKYAIPSATLSLDTYIESQDWDSTHRIARAYMGFKNWAKDPYHETLFGIASDAHFKMIDQSYKQNKHEETLAKVEEFKKLYMKSSRLEDVIFIASQAALASEKTDLGKQYLSQLIKDFPESGNTGAALLTRSELHEKKYEFVEASKDINLYLSLKVISDKISDRDKNKLKLKALTLGWLAPGNVQLRALLDKKDFCAADIAVDCDRYDAVLAIHSKTYDPMKAFEKATKGHVDNRPLWASVALQNQNDFAFPDRLLLVRVVAGRWDNIDPYIQLSLLPSLSDSLPKAFELNRGRISRYAKLSANEKSINRRISLIKEMEETATRAMKLPWARIKASLLSEIAQLYVDLAQNLSELPVPEGLPEAEVAAYRDTIQKLVFPFEEKGQTIRGKAFEVASQNSIHSQAFNKIAHLYFRDNPSMEKFLKGDMHIQQATPIDVALLGELDPDTEWSKILRNKYDIDQDKVNYIKASWLDSLKSENWARVAFLIQEAKKSKKIDENTMRIMQAYSFARAGGVSEALYEISKFADDTDKGAPKRRAYFTLLTYSLSSLDKKNTKKWLEELKDASQTQLLSNLTFGAEESFALAYSAKWSGFELSDREYVDLLKDAKKSKFNQKVEWARQELERIKKDQALKLAQQQAK